MGVHETNKHHFPTPQNCAQYPRAMPNSPETSAAILPSFSREGIEGWVRGDSLDCAEPSESTTPSPNRWLASKPSSSPLKLEGDTAALSLTNSPNPPAHFSSPGPCNMRSKSRLDRLRVGARGRRWAQVTSRFSKPYQYTSHRPICVSSCSRRCASRVKPSFSSRWTEGTLRVSTSAVSLRAGGRSP